MSQPRNRKARLNRFELRCGALPVCLLSLVSVLFVIGPERPTAAASNGLWSVLPTTRAGQAPRPFIEPELTPGKTYADSVMLANYTSGTLTFHIYAADAVNTAGGGLSLRPRTAVQSDIGGWIHLPYTSLSVPGHGNTEVPFTIEAPRQAAPGDHVGGIVAEDTRGTSSKSGPVPVTVVQAVGVRIYGRVVGPLHRGLALPEVSLSVQNAVASEFSSSVDVGVKFRVKNSGNTVLSPMATVKLSSPVGTVATQHFVVNEILPGSTLAYHLRFPGQMTYGHLRVEVSVNGHGASASKVSTVWTVPWGLLALVVLAVAAVVLMTIRWRRSRRPRTQPAETHNGR